MRLRQIKLAGFKSFIDPTPIDIPGTLVGVVGPNGCGKSNVIDAVRWVLGESKAAELRGESMQDVIFNGSVSRKPAGRASVELSFDNLDGRIGGPWSDYAEISVKRVLTRDGNSSYHINNQTVRRRDVHDMFLGTGLGPRAYAIIGQGMITRIVEARPEELRIFLEEAAGVSKYKERRRETENRLADTRDNLIRVEDIVRELDAQISKLEQQATVAQTYRSLQARHDEQQQFLWLTRKRDADLEREKAARDLSNRTVAIESHIAELRAAERALEEIRQAHFASSDSMHAAQGALFEVNAEVAKLESEIRLIGESRTRLTAQLQSLATSRDSRLTEQADLQRRGSEIVQTIAETERQLAEARARVDEREATLPQLEDAYRAKREAMAATSANAALAQQSIETADAVRQQADRLLAQLTQRRERLNEEKASISSADEPQLATLKEQLQRVQQEVEGSADAQRKSEAQVEQAAAQRQYRLDDRAAQTETLARIEARLQALQQVQTSVEANEKLDPWLRSHQLDKLPRLFRKLSVENGWETAFEAVLRERVRGVELQRLEQLDALAADAPPARVAFYSTAGAIARDGAQPAGLRRLSDLVRTHDASFAALLSDWLANVYVADDLQSALATRDRLPPGGQFVVKQAHRVARHDVHFYAADDPTSGLLARRLEIENLQRQVRAQRLIVDEAITAVARAEAEARDAQQRRDAGRESAERQRAQVHALQLEAVRLEELIGRVRHRSGQIDAELQEIDANERDARAQRGDADQRFGQLDSDLSAQRQSVDEARLAYEDADQALRAARDEQRTLEMARQQCEFALTSNRERGRELARSAEVAGAEAQRLADEIARAEAELKQLDDSQARGKMADWIERRSSADEALRAARSRMEELALELRSADEKRMTLERDVQPLRDKLTDLQLKEQAARLAAEQFAEQLREAGADEAELLQKLSAQPAQKASVLQAEIARLAQEIEALGAVNLAALEELTTSRERKSFLDTQANDLNEAVRTLEDAIRKIDRETRQLLQQTFDAVNVQFGQLFPKLFGGGEARLIMTGEEILDAGVQVMAQPPGKRNSTIHLMSGGEKALTATALVFALFKLNPAPFCLLDEVDAPLDDANTERFCRLVESMTDNTQFVFITHNKISMEMAQQLIGVTMQEQGVSRIVAVDVDSAVQMTAEAA